MLKASNQAMNAKIALFTVLAVAAVFAMITPIDYAVAQTSDSMSDDEDEYKDGKHEGKSCPNKERKSASTNTGLGI